jgi:choloylglycine hydrolase
MAYAPGDAPKTLAAWEVGSWLLENFATVDEARAGLADIVVPAVVLSQWKFAPEVHFVVRDTTGTSIVVEVVGGAIKVHEAPLGVITNSPTYDWHMTNLRNYVNFSMTNVPPVKLGSVTLTPLGQGTGMLGLPGDFTPPSRFVRAVAFTQSVPPEPTGREAVIEAFRILNNFDIPKGAARGAEKDEHGNIVADYTIWTSAIDLTTRTYFFRTYTDSRIRSVNLMNMAIDGGKIVTIPTVSEEEILPLVP